jgi:hypothetical protein
MILSRMGLVVTVGLVLLPSMVTAFMTLPTYTGFNTYTNPTGKYKE